MFNNLLNNIIAATPWGSAQAKANQNLANAQLTAAKQVTTAQNAGQPYRPPVSNVSNNYNPTLFSPASSSSNNSSSGGSSGSNGGNTSIFRNNLSSLSPIAYASNGNDVYNTYKSALSPSTSTQPATFNASANVFSDLLKSIGSGLSGLIGSTGMKGLTGEAVKSGSWFNMPDFGYTEANAASPLANTSVIKGIQGAISGYGQPSSYVSPISKTTDNNTSQQQRFGDLNSKYSSLTGSGSQTGSGSSNLSSNLQAIFNSIDESMKPKYDEINARMMNGEIGQEEAARQAAALQDEANNLLYDQLISQQQGELPLLEKDFTNNSQYINDASVLAKNNANTAKVENKNIYGDAMRKMVGNQGIIQKNINDVYTAAGTAGGSDYLSAMSGAARDTGNNVANSERELASANAKIDAQQNAYELETKNKVNQLLLDKEKAVKTITDNVNMSRTQKTAATKEINSKLATDLANIRNTHEQQTNAFEQMKIQDLTNSSNLIKNAVVSDSLYNRTATPTGLDAGSNPNSTTDSRNLVGKVRVNSFGQKEVFVNGKWQVLPSSTA
jgi:hypothetical protein